MYRDALSEELRARLDRHLPAPPAGHGRGAAQPPGCEGRGEQVAPDAVGLDASLAAAASSSSAACVPMPTALRGQPSGDRAAARRPLLERAAGSAGRTVRLRRPTRKAQRLQADLVSLSSDSSGDSDSSATDEEEGGEEAVRPSGRYLTGHPGNAANFAKRYEDMQVRARDDVVAGRALRLRCRCGQTNVVRKVASMKRCVRCGLARTSAWWLKQPAVPMGDP